MATTLHPATLPRLAAIVAGDQVQPDGALDVGVEFGMGPESFPIVRVRVSGAIGLICQRCMAPVSWPLDLKVALTAVPSDSQADELADPFDSVVLDEEGGLRLRTAVEDEILAALPLVPLHHDGVDCAMTVRRSGDPAVPAGTVNRPFAGLAALMRRHGGDDRST